MITVGRPGTPGGARWLARAPLPGGEAGRRARQQCPVDEFVPRPSSGVAQLDLGQGLLDPDVRLDVDGVIVLDIAVHGDQCLGHDDVAGPVERQPGRLPPAGPASDLTVEAARSADPHPGRTWTRSHGPRQPVVPQHGDVLGMAAGVPVLRRSAAPARRAAAARPRGLRHASRPAAGATAQSPGSRGRPRSSPPRRCSVTAEDLVVECPDQDPVQAAVGQGAAARRVQRGRDCPAGGDHRVALVCRHRAQVPGTRLRPASSARWRPGPWT